VSKKLQEKQRRRLAEQMKKERQRKAARRSNLVTIGIAAAIVITVGAMVFFTRANQGNGSVAPAPEGVSASAAKCEEPQEHEVEGSQHVDTSETVQYETSPPTSGNHWPPGQQADAGFYTDTVANESLVHNMEHGQIIIWYSPDAPQATIDDIEGLIENANDYDNPDLPAESAQPLIAVPYDDIPEGKNFVLTGWGVSEGCKSYSLAAIDEFRTSYQGRGPEQVTVTFEG
jgi:hypothetical protein